MSIAEGMVLVTGAVVAGITFFHSLFYSIRGKVSKKAYRMAKYGFGFLISGMVAFWFCTQSVNSTDMTITVSGDKYLLLLGISGLWMFVGLIYVIRYFFKVATSQEKEQTK